MSVWRLGAIMFLRFLATAALLLLTACNPVIPKDEFTSVAADVALAPQLTCDELKVVFGVPELTTVADPSELGLEYEEVRLTTWDNVQLRVWYIPAANERGVLLLANGAVGELPCYLMFARELVPLGWTIVMYDYRGFGASTGSPSLLSLYTDNDLVLDWTLERSGRDTLTVMGVSLGTLPSIAEAVFRPSDVNAVVVDGIVSLRQQVERFWYLVGGLIDEYVALFGDALQIESLLPFVDQPVLGCIYGLDEWTPPAEARSLFAPARDVEILEYPTLLHARGPYLATESYFERLNAFLTRIWGD
jgi:uncharacterized protein